MSGITGIYYRDGRSVSEKQIKYLNDHLSHRGPDGSSVWVGKSVALGHQMMFTTPESLNERLPFYDDEKGLIITSDARIDNREELSNILGIENRVNVPDSYFILKAYQKWGVKCPEKLLGDFSFAIWDENKERLFCARDHMGIKPFYYYLSEEVFFFATEIKALICQDEIPKNLNKLRIADYLISLNQDKEITFYEYIFRLPPASTLEIKLDKEEKSIFWELDPRKETVMDSDEEYAEKFLEIFTEAVKCRMRSEFPIGSLLSGGLDSSSIVCVASKLSAENNPNYSLKTFSSVFDELAECDERYYIGQVKSLYNIESCEVVADNLSPLSQIDEILELLKEPFNTPNLYLSREIYKHVKKKDVRILFDGFDGDSTVFYESLYVLDIFREKRFRKLFEEIKYMARMNGLNRWQMLIIAIVLPLIPESIKNGVQKVLDLFRINLTIVENDSIDLLDKDFIQITDFKNRYKQLYKDSLVKANTNKLRHHLALNSGILQHAMEIFDVISANYSFEHVYPFFDVRLVEFCLSLPKEQKYSQMWDRVVMRRAMGGILPPEIQWRTTKAGLGMNFRRNMLLYDEKELENVIYKDVENINDFVETDYLKEVYKQYKENTACVNPLPLWLTAVLSIWIKNKN